MSTPPERAAASTAGATGHGDDPAPMFSFVSTAYRTEDVLDRMIRSVVAQTCDDWELVVVDNGWSDPIAAVVQPYLADSRITLLRQENQGTAGGIRAAAAAARGRYLVTLNSDDAVTPEYCARMAAWIAAEPDADAFTCDAHRFTDPGERRMDGTYLYSAGLPHPPDPQRSLLLHEIIDGPCPYYTAPIRRDVWDSVGGFVSELPLVDDLDFWLRAVVAGHDIRMVPDVLGRFRVEAGSESRPVDDDRAEEYEAQRQLAFIRAAEQSTDPEVAAALDRVLRRLRYQQSLRRARRAFRAGDTTTARVHAAAAHAERRTLRTGVLVVGLRVAPAVLRLVHPAKRRLRARLQDVRRLRGRRRT